MNRDSWDTDARKRLLRWVLDAPSRERGDVYAPDTTYEMLRAKRSGPHTLAIADILGRWALMWAQDMRESKAAGIELDQEVQWAANMREADAEIDRYAASNHLTRAA